MKTTENGTKKARLNRLISIYFKGIAMGTADVIPGVSGGTIAFITGIYDDLVTGLANMSLRHLKALLLYMLNFKSIEKRTSHYETLSEISWLFFIALGAGILTAILSLAKIIPFFMENYPVETYGLFFGLILVSAKIPFAEMKHKALDIAVLVVFTLGFFLFFNWAGELEGSLNPIYVFLSGAIAICALVLPGISGAYILVILGEYKIILEALHERQVSTILIFMSGMLVGLFSFIHILKWLLDHHRSFTMAALTGIMLGSLTVVWPLKHVPEGESANILSMTILIIIGGGLVLGLEYWGRNEDKG